MNVSLPSSVSVLPSESSFCIRLPEITKNVVGQPTTISLKPVPSKYWQCQKYPCLYTKVTLQYLYEINNSSQWQQVMWLKTCIRWKVGKKSSPNVIVSWWPDNKRSFCPKVFKGWTIISTKFQLNPPSGSAAISENKTWWWLYHPTGKG